LLIFNLFEDKLMWNKYRLKVLTLSVAFLATLLTSTTILSAEESYSASANADYPVNVLWGDTHLHTSYSLDAGMFGNKNLGPEQAYQFARGDGVQAHNGMTAKLDRPLDFLVVADHAEYLGLLNLFKNEDPKLLASEDGKRWKKMLQGDRKQVKQAFVEMTKDITTVNPLLLDKSLFKTPWQDIIKAADKYNEPGRFTAFIGYEWSSMPKGNNLHRVVVFADDASKANQILPFSAFESENVEGLWAFLDDYEEKTGGRVLAIPHNGNLSNGKMFSTNDLAGNPIKRSYAQTRARWEPLYEVTQMKGDSESHPSLSLNDEFANFEVWDKGNIQATEIKAPAMLQHEYARSALKLGLKIEQDLGSNPFKFGLIGSTDAHTSLSAVEESNYWGKMSLFEPSKSRVAFKHKGPLFSVSGEEFGSSGYAAVWATNNTRASIFDAMKRRETYATTGPRMTVRFFAGWNFEDNEVSYPDYAARGYAKGVPMGGDLIGFSNNSSPKFMIVASKDPAGANLDRVQVVKGWLDCQGQLHEKVHNVVWSDNRKQKTDGSIKDVGNTVDTKQASWTNDIGASELATVWTDPEFNKEEKAFYYVRVLQIPTPRWTVYDEKYFKFTIDKKLPETIQERAYTSPIWYTP
jgi:hypothetical protein